MSARNASRATKFFAAAPIVATVMTLAACSDYTQRRDTIAYSAGDAMAHNRAIHIIDPWPNIAFNRRLPAQGARLDTPMRVYRAGPADKPGGATNTLGATPTISVAN